MSDRSTLEPRPFDAGLAAFGGSLEVNSLDGSASLQLPLRLTEGRLGFGPSLGLGYGGGLAGSTFGVGWSLGGAESVGRDVHWRLPRYVDGEDRWHLGGTEIVPVLDADGSPVVRRQGEHSIERFRSRIERLYDRIERWTDETTGAVHWRRFAGDGTVSIYGRRADGLSRLADPEHPDRVAQWLIESRHHPRGDAILFEYKAEDLAGVDPAAPEEYGRLGAVGHAMRHLKRLRWGASQPWGVDETVPEDLEWRFEAVFDYGEHDDVDGAPRYAEARPWSARDDAFSTYRSGFELRTRRLCRRVVMFHRFPELGPDPVAVGATELTHELRDEGAVLVGARYRGFRPAEDGGGGASRATPAVTLDYARADVGEGFLPGPSVAEGGLAASVHRREHLFIDLFSEGVPGLLVRDSDAWLWRENLGDGRFAEPRVLAQVPQVASLAFELRDADGDGQVELSAVAGRDAGAWSYDTATRSWAGHATTSRQARVDFGNAGVQLADLDGDGYPDLVVDRHDHFLWYPADGRDGFAEARRLDKPVLEGGDVVGFGDRAGGFLFADMSGDGLADLVRVSSGRVEYWPHLGQGRFGDVVVMGSPPTLPAADRLDRRRLRLADLTGNGTADLLYLGDGEIHIWHNLSGNRFGAERRLGGLPRIDSISTVQIHDLLGRGRPCLVWMNPTAQGASPIQYLPIHGEVQPGLLRRFTNGLGLEHELEWRWSGRDYLEARASGRPWSTRTPRHRSVVVALRGVDRVHDQHRASLYRYRDGAFDHDDRRFVGFGRVEIHDRELGSEEPAPPSLTRLWSHLGAAQPAALDGAWDGDPEAVQPEPLTRADELVLATEDWDEAARAITGLSLRREVYACDADGTPDDDPLFVSLSGYQVTRLQPGRSDVARAAFAPRHRERLSYTYETSPNDPRTAHEIELDHGPFGGPALTAAVHYARRAVPGRIAAQTVARGSVERRRRAHVDRDDAYAVNIGLETEGFEIDGLGARSIPWSFDELARRVRDALAASSDFGSSPPPGLGARRVAWRRWSYWNRQQTAIADPASAGPDGLGTPVLLHHLDAAVAPRDHFATVYEPLGDADELIAEAGLVEADGHLWATGPQSVYGDREIFHRVLEEVGPDGVTGRFTYQHDHLAVASWTQVSTGNTVRGELDPITTAFRRIVDHNGGVTEAAYDALGIAVRTATFGDQEGRDGAIHRFGADPLVAGADPHGGLDLDAALANPTVAIDTASTAVFYDLDTFASAGSPCRVLRLLRDDPAHDGEGGPPALIADQVQTEIEYLDGLGRGLQRKRRADAGPAIVRGDDGEIVVADGRIVEAESAERWLASGFVHTAGNGDVLAHYERFFSPTSAFEDDAVLRTHGVSRAMHYDALGRVVRVDYPDGTTARTEIEAWRSVSFDRNDSVVGTRWEAERAGLAASHPERRALDQARAHADTPGEVLLDVLGNVAVGIEHGEAGSRLETRHEGDTGAGEMRWIDARGLVCSEQRLDMLGRPMWQDSHDAGASWTLLGWDSRPRRRRDGRGVVLRHRHDAAGRPIELRADVPGDGERLVERIVYGDDPSITDADRRNLRGTKALIFDDAGVEEVRRRSPFGTRLAESRRFRTEHRQTVDWSDPTVVELEADAWSSSHRLDALGRPVRRILADGTRIDQRYGRLGELARVEVTTADGALDRHPVLVGADYDALGRRRRVELGNGVVLDHAYRPDNHRLERARATDSGGRLLQDLRYAYDPVGNIVVADDTSQAPGAAGTALGGLAVTAEKRFRHDAHYRLIEASGRAHRALLIGDHASGFGEGPAFKSTRHITLDNGVEIERYRRTYAYDAGGNLTRIRHLGETARWTREFWVSATSNRSLPALDAGGLPVVDPESAFDAAGQLIRQDHLRSIRWSWSGRLARSVLIDRGGPGLDDAEYNVYGAAGGRLRRIVERRVDGAMEWAETRFLPGCEIRRVHRPATDTDLLRRSTATIAAAGQDLVRLHQWQTDTAGREVDDTAEKRLRYPLADHLGSASLELDDLGRVVTAEEFFPYGGTAFIAGDRREVTIKETRFTGALRDDATGFYCFEFRHYAPWIGNWISPDPAGLVDGLNLYRYARNNPVHFVDPTGLDSIGIGNLDEAPEAVRRAVVTPGQDARTIVHNYASSLSVEIDGQEVALEAEVVAITDAQGQFVRWFVDFTRGDPVQVIALDNDDLSLVIVGGEDPLPGDHSSADPTTGGPGGAGVEGDGPGAGDEGKDEGGGGGDETTIGPGDADGMEAGTGDGKADEAPVRPGDGRGTESGNDDKARPGSKSGVDGRPAEPSEKPQAEKKKANGDESKETDRRPEDRRTGDRAQDGGTTQPPPGLPTTEDGVPWSPELGVTPLDEIPDGAQFTTDPSQVNRHGRGDGDSRGVPGRGESPNARPGGQGGQGQAGTGGDSANGASQGARGGSSNDSVSGNSSNTSGKRGLKSGFGSHELPTALSWIDPALDVLQIGLDLIGLIPGFGEIADGVNVLVSLARGDYLGASLSFAAMIPFAGWAATAGKFGRKAVNAVDAASDVGGAVMRHGDEAVDVGRQASRQAPAGGTLGADPRKVYKTAEPSSSMVVQELDYSCGAACARQLLSDEGIEVGEAALRRSGFDPSAGMQPEAVAWNLNRAAKEQGSDLVFQGGRSPMIMPDDWHQSEAFMRTTLENTNGSFIALTKRHFVIVDGMSNGMVRIRDPWGLSGPGSANGLEATIEASRFVTRWKQGGWGIVWR